LFDPNTAEMKPDVREIVNQMAYGYQVYIGQAETSGRVNQGRPYRALYLLEAKTRLKGESIKRAYAMRQTAGLQQGFYVSLEFDRAGGRTFRTLTGDNVQKRLAVVLDNTVYSAPVIREEIGGGQAQISGSFTSREANNLAVILQEGALPARAIIEELRSIDPMLGMDSIKQGLRAGFIGAAAVVLFMVGYYYFCGLVADLALLLNILFLVGCMCLFKSTLTMPGIAGIVLFIGMAVDANVLIYERIREEMAAKPDRAISLSVDRGYDRAFAVIFDSNLTTLITSLILFQFGSGPVQGFAITLSLGIIISMLTAIVVTRIIIDFWTNNLGHRSIRMGGWRWLQTRKIGFYRIRNVCFAASILVIIAGLAVLAARRGEILGIDFTGGTLMRIGFDKEISAGDLRTALAATEVAKSETRIQREKAIGRLKATGEVEAAGQSQFAAVYQVRFKEKLTFEDLKLNEVLNKIGITGVHAERAGAQEEQVGGQITGRLRTQALWALFYSTVLIVIYVSVRFEFVFAITSVIALFHDMAISCGLFALASLVLPFRIEINLPEIAALLTIFGYSINDTIVVFDRIRENVRPGRGDFTELVDRSINETLPRTTITSFTTILTALALLFFGGPVVFSFALMLVFGLITGTYSSIFIASALVVLWKRHKQKQAAQVVTQRVPS
jgi:SecD/SecF fusion protein